MPEHQHDDDCIRTEDVTAWWRRPLVKIREVKVRLLSPDFTLKSLVSFAPSLRIGTLFGSPLRAAITTAVLVGGPAAGIMAAETTGATDLLDQDPQLISVTVLANEPGQVTVAFGADDQPTNIFDEIKAAIEDIETAPEVTVTVAAVSPEVAQFLTQIGIILDGLPTRFNTVNGGLAAVRADIAALGSGDAEMLALLRAIAAAIFPPGQGCPACPDSLTSEEPGGSP